VILDNFQYDVLDFMDAAKGRCIYADPMGARKTGTTLTWLDKQPIRRVLVVAPSAVHGHWAREAERFYLGADVYCGTGTVKQRATARAGVTTGGVGFPALYLTTYESMKQDEPELLALKFDAVVFDEGHKLKGRRTAVALTANAVCRSPKHILILSGTPVINGAEELWQYLHMLSPKLYRSYWAWVEKHFVVEIKMFRGNRFPTRLIHGFREGQEDVVKAQLAGVMIQRPIEELFAFDEWTKKTEDVVIPVKLTGRERKFYDDLVDRDWSRELTEDIQVENKLALGVRLQQITSEWGALDDTVPDGAKVVAAEGLLHGLTRRGPVVVFAQFQATCNRLASRLAGVGISAQPYHGGIELALRDRAVEEFRTGKLDVLVGTLASLGEGVDGLQNLCSQVMFLDRHWTHARNDQAIGRLRRSGQNRRVTVYHLMAEDTIDVAVVAACFRKANVVESLNGRPLRDVLYGQHFKIEVDDAG
jgi:SNF2 family DNA or RNA helicase